MPCVASLSPASPPGLERYGHALGAYPPCWPVSGLVEATFIVFPSACSKRSVTVMKAVSKRHVHLPLRGQRRLRTAACGTPSCFPLNCGMRTTPRAPTPRILRRECLRHPYNETLMANQTPIDQIAERVERLLLRYEELQRTNALLTSQVETLSHERDSLKSRLSAARARVDALLERIPDHLLNHKDPT